MKNILWVSGQLTVMPVLVSGTAENVLLTRSPLAAENPAEIIIDKIGLLIIDVRWQKNQSVADETTAQNMREAVQNKNPTLTENDKAHLYFTGGALKIEESVPVIVYAHVGQYTASKNLKFRMSQPTAVDIANKIVNTQFRVNWCRHHMVDDPDMSASISEGMRKVNPELQDADVAKIIYFSNIKLIENEPVPVTAMIQFRGESARRQLTVIMAPPTPQDVINKISDLTVEVGYTNNYSVKSRNTRYRLRKALREYNTDLNDADVVKLFFRGSNLKLGQQVTVVVFIAGWPTVSKEIYVTMNYT